VNPEKPASDKEGRAARRKDAKAASRDQPALLPSFVEPLPEERTRVRPGRSSGGSRSQMLPGNAASSFFRLLQAVRTPTRRRRTGRPDNPTARDYRQRCSVRVNYTGRPAKGHFAAHARYLVRESAAEGTPAFGTVAEVPLVETLQGWQQAGDKRLWKLIISPEFGERLDLKALTTGLMSAISHDLNRRLEWAAVEHRNTEHPHVHVVLRGVCAEGRELRFAREYLQSAIRGHAQDLCTQQLGHRSHDDVRLALENEVERFRFTSLDRRIWRFLGAGDREAGVHYDPQHRGHHAQFPHHPLLQARLQFLARAGVVSELNQGQFIVPLDLDWQLRQMGTAADRQRMLHNAGVAISDDRLVQHVTPARDISQLRGRVLAHVEDERTESPTLILEGTDGVVHFIRHDRQIDMARGEGRLAPNHLIEFHNGQIKDLGDADALLRSGILPPALPSELASASHGWRGWLGRYHTALVATSHAALREQTLDRDDFER
jgi:type IV secretory pathway VirD2 relaxase